MDDKIVPLVFISPNPYKSWCKFMPPCQPKRKSPHLQASTVVSAQGTSQQLQMFIRQTLATYQAIY